MTVKTVIANNSLGREKEMTLEEYTRRAITDHRCMCSTAEQFKLADELLAKQRELAENCFNTLWQIQNKEKV